MSRRHAPTTRTTLGRTLGAALAIVLAATALLPSAVTAQANDAITSSTIQHEWQLLTQRNAKGEPEDVPAGVGATMLLRSDAAFGEAACSTYDSSYSQQSDVLAVFVEPEEIVWRECDDISRDFDELFYANLDKVVSIARADDVLVLNDDIGEALMVFTRAAIENDPTAARWSLARISDAEGASKFVLTGLDPWMEFLVGGSLVGNSGCGAFLGKYQTNEGRVDITDIHYRLSGCPDGARDQAEQILTTLSEITDFQVRPAGLALKDGGGITRLGLVPDLDVASRTWTPIALYDATGNKTYGDGNELTTSAIQFRGPNYEGRSICRPFGGKAIRSGLAVSIGRPTFQLKPSACKGSVAAGPLGHIEEGFTTALEDAASYALRGDELTLTDVDGVLRAVLEPQPPLTGTTWELFKMRNGKKLTVPQTDVPITATFEDIDASTLGFVQGNTGVKNAYDENTYFGNFDIPAATRIEVEFLEVFGNACAGKRRKTKVCKTEQRFIKLLQQADGYIVRPEDLKFYAGRKNILVFRPQQLTDSDG